MSKETKVGLVVGLGFIVMFAVILSKKAGTVPYAELERDIAIGGEGPVQVVDSAFSSPKPAQETPPAAPAVDQHPQERIVHSLPTRNDIAPEPAGTAAFNPSAQTAEAPQRPAYPGLAPRDLSGEGIALPKVMAGQGVEAPNSIVTEAPSDAPDPAAVVNLPAQISTPDETTTPTAPPTPAEQLREDLKEERLASPAESGPKKETEPADAPKTAEPKAAPPEPSPLNDRKIKTKQYIAKANDTLYRIAVRYYGSKHPDGAQHIFEANSDKLKAIDKLKIGQKLIIPEWEGATGEDGFASAEPEPEPVAEEIPATVTLAAERPKTAPPAPALKKVDPEKNVIQPEQKFRIYEVKENESFSTIAEREMGTMHLWKELHRANQDKIPTPEKLRVGAKIRIPLDLIAHNGEADDEDD